MSLLTLMGWGWPNSDSSIRDDDELIKMVAVIGEYVIQTLDEAGKSGRTQAKVDHARMRPSEAKDEIAKVAIVGNENAPLTMGDTENVCIGERCRVLSCDNCDFVARPDDVGR